MHSCITFPVEEYTSDMDREKGRVGTMSFCRFCGFTIAEQATRCPHCGNIPDMEAEEEKDLALNSPIMVDYATRHHPPYPTRTQVPYDFATPLRSSPAAVSRRAGEDSSRPAVALVLLVTLLLAALIIILLTTGVNAFRQITQPTTDTQQDQVIPLTNDQTPDSEPWNQGQPTVVATFGAATATPESTPGATATTTPASLTPQQHAQALIEHYYASINNKHYRTAYNLWQHNPQSYASFAQGFVFTEHDDIFFDRIDLQHDGSVVINMRIDALEVLPSGSRHTHYQGYYRIEPQPDQTWKITVAHFTPTT